MSDMVLWSARLSGGKMDQSGREDGNPYLAARKGPGFGGTKCGAAQLTFETTDLACFVRGTLIETAAGLLAVEDIADGTLVRTMDNGLQPVRQVLSKTVSGQGPLAPVVLKAGVLGNARDLLVSPHHRMLISGWQAELLTGEAEVLAAASHLVNGDRVFRQPCAEVEYFHLLFDTHEIIFAEGSATESYHPFLADSGTRAPETLAELMAIFPELEEAADTFGDAARPRLNLHEAALLNL